LRVNLVGRMVHGTMLSDSPAPSPRQGSLVLAAVLFALASAAVWWLVIAFPKTP